MTMPELDKIHRGDNCGARSTLPESALTLVVTSPPYTMTFAPTAGTPGISSAWRGN